MFSSSASWELFSVVPFDLTSVAFDAVSLVFGMKKVFPAQPRSPRSPVPSWWDVVFADCSTVVLTGF